MNTKLRTIYLFITKDGKIKFMPLDMSGKNNEPILDPYDGEGFVPMIVDPTRKVKTSVEKASKRVLPTNNLLAVIVNGGKELTEEQSLALAKLKPSGKEIKEVREELEMSLSELGALEKELNSSRTKEQMKAFVAKYQNKYKNQCEM